jgi:hypothetical protein
MKIPCLLFSYKIRISGLGEGIQECAILRSTWVSLGQGSRWAQSPDPESPLVHEEGENGMQRSKQDLRKVKEISLNQQPFSMVTGWPTRDTRRFFLS